MKGYTINLEEAAIANTDYRRVLYTSRNMQLVLMCVRPGEEIGEEIHHLDQFIRVDAGHARVFLDGVTHDLADGWAVVIPAGTRHNVVNAGDEDLKLYTVYAPPEHKDGIVEPTKADEVEEHFDGVTTE